MTQVYVGIGSNIDRDKNVQGGIIELKRRFENIIVSPVYLCPAFGFEGDDFYNLVVGFETNKDVDQVSSELREIEFQFGRKRNETRFSSRTLDIDLLLYGDLVNSTHDIPRSDILKYAFVLKPLADIAPDLVHPTTGRAIASIWSEFNKPEFEFTQTKLDLND